ncbi:hypothetical protein ECA2821 [Pectobacterium atrosepticum SCRI1043]|uniref:Uncharacterized protein n=1 Tax=Pectobacterium atrosepticum (strain SCRI 1043 / ATCC BAA-672) TaxID=218491 RepID=Q6D3C3_PECAS|nr:hypothetical protein ECA2821 [Pectobacterium atrosepticum SCRI1043]
MFVGGRTEAGKRHRLTIFVTGCVVTDTTHSTNKHRPTTLNTRCFILSANGEICHHHDTGYKNSIKKIIAELDD